MATAVQLAQNNHKGRCILEASAHVGNDVFPPEALEAPDTPSHINERAQWYLGFLHVINGMANLIMTIPLQVKYNVGQWAAKLKYITIDNNGIRPASPEWDKGVPCACPSSHPCSLYDICRRRCMRTVDQSGTNLPISQESSTERQFEDANEAMKNRVDTRRIERSSSTRQLEESYGNLQKRITSYLCQLVNESKLQYSILKRWVYSLRFNLRAQIPERNPPVEKMLNKFYSRFYDTERLRELMVKVEKHLKEPWPLAMKTALQKFEDEVDTYLASRVHGLNGDGQQVALFCVDPEWRLYPAHDLYQVHKRACEALQRVTGQQFIAICFCTVLTEYILLNVANSFAQKIKDRVERQPACVDEANSRIRPPLSEEIADTPPSRSESAKIEDQSKFPFCKISANDHSGSELVPGGECVALDITSSLNMKSGWSSLEYMLAESERVPLLISPVKVFFSPHP